MLQLVQSSGRYPEIMKTAISLPHELFQRAESAAHRLGMSRSELYAKALAEFLKRDDSKSITERLNDVYSRNTAQVDPGLHSAQLKAEGFFSIPVKYIDG